MNMKRIMLLMTWLTGLMALAGLSTCEERPYLGFVDCNQCYSPKPEECLLSIDLTLPETGRGVPLVIYRGDVEDGQVERIDTSYLTPYAHWVSFGQEYSVRAEYFVNNATVFVIDGTKPELRVSDDCEEKCWVVVNTKIDARLNDRFP